MTRAVGVVPYELVCIMCDAGFFAANEAAVLGYLDGRGPLVCYCARKACAQCRPVWTASSSSSGGGSGSDRGGKKRAMCPARRLAVSLSVTLFQLLPLMARAVLWLELQGGEEQVEAVTAAYSMYEAVVVLCLRVHRDRYQQEQQQQQGKLASGMSASGAGASSSGSSTGKGGAGGKCPGGSGDTNAGSGSSSRDSSTGTATAAPALDDTRPSAAGTQEGQVHSWRELLLSLQPFRLLRLVLQEPRRGAREEPGGPWEAPFATFMAGPAHLL